MPRLLLIAIFWHDGRYHGVGDWPPAPSPARLFQALLAAAVRGGRLAEDDAAALCWLETLPPPVMAAPLARQGSSLTSYVPNNDLDAVGGHPLKIKGVSKGVEKTRTAQKTIRPMLFDASVPLLTAWPLPDADTPHLPALIGMAERLYQFGRGVDMAWATAEVVDDAAAEARLAAHPGPKQRPSAAGQGGTLLACPQQGSLDSLIARHDARATRFRPGPKKGSTVFVQPPKARFRMVPYGCPPTQSVFEIRAGAAFSPSPLSRAAALVETLRDSAAQRLRTVLPTQAATIERLLIGRGATAADVALRPRLVPLPSIGIVHADHAIRRILLEVPPDCPLPPEALRAALLGLSLHVDAQTGEVLPDARLVPAADDSFIRHYGLGERARPARLWRSITPMALPGPPARAGRAPSQRLASESAQRDAVRQALRHAGIAETPISILVQREPFSERGLRAELFAHGARFPATVLRHVELRFAQARGGPLLLGNGRWLGLGLFAPVAERSGVVMFDVTDGLAGATDGITAALRRAVMARVRDHSGSDRLHPFFTGHAADGAPLRDGNHRHLAFAVDPGRRRLLVIAPHALEGRTSAAWEAEHLAILEAALADLVELRAGPAGLLRLRAIDPVPEEDPLLATANTWRSITPYTPTRHAKALPPAEAVAEDVRRECRRRGWPEPSCEIQDLRMGPRGGISAMLRLRFAVARGGPILLGRSAHLGGGLFAACRD